MSAAAPLLTLPPVTTLTIVRDDVADALAHAETLVAASKHHEAVAELEEIWLNVRNDQALALRQRLALSWSEMTLGNIEHAAGLLEQADGIVRSPRFDASDRADVLFRRGCVDFQRGNVAEAINELTLAIDLNAQAALPRPLVAANAYEWRSRCYQFRRDWDAAGSDAERALDIASRIRDEPAQARALFQASLVAERERDWLVARVNAEQALGLFRKHGNTLAVARVLNNLGGIDFLLGNADVAEAHLLAAIEAADAAGSEPDLAQAVSSLAQVYLRTNRPSEARVRAERAAELLTGRVDFLDELANAQLVVAGSLAAEGDADGAASWLDRADRTVDALGSASHRAAALIARGDLVRSLGDPDAAAGLFRRAAESLQDLHF
ncbi:MAG: tetratricopeptide repeat protein [Actinomycetota bacterium]